MVDRFKQFRNRAKWPTLISALVLFVTDLTYHSKFIYVEEGRVVINSPPLLHLLWIILFVVTMALALITALKWQSVVGWIVILWVVYMKITL